MSQKYLAGTYILQARATTSASPAWRGILKARDCLRDGFRFRLGNGNSSLWYEDSSGEGKLVTRVPFVKIADTNVKLRNLIRGRTCCLDQLYTMLPDDAKESLLGIEPRLVDTREDGWGWEASNTGKYTVNEAFNKLNSQDKGERSASRSWRWVWRLRVPEKVRVFVWIMLQGGLQTNANRSRCGMAVSPACSWCSSLVEDTMNCLRDCPHSREIWSRLGAISWRNFRQDDLWTWVHGLSCGSQGTKFLGAL